MGLKLKMGEMAKDLALLLTGMALHWIIEVFQDPEDTQYGYQDEYYDYYEEYGYDEEYDWDYGWHPGLVHRPESHNPKNPQDGC